MPKLKKAMVFGDWHMKPKGLNSPYRHDPRIIRAFHNVCDIENPDLLVGNGDLVENASYSHWMGYDRTDLHKEVTLFKRVITPFLKWPMIYLAGNHELWTQKFLNIYDPQRRDMMLKEKRDLFAEDYGLKEMGIKYLPYQHQRQPHIKLGGLRVYHGDRVNGFAGYTAKNALDRTWTSILINHTHRLGASCRTVGFPENSKTHGAWENGCMCNLDDTFGGRAPILDSQHGFTMVYYEDKPKGYFHVVQVPILKGRFVMNGKLYKS